MSTLRTKSTSRHRSAAHWPATPEIDGFLYELGPSPEDAAWAAEALNQGDEGHTSEFLPDDVLDRLADEAAEVERLERGLRFF